MKGYYLLLILLLLPLVTNASDTYISFQENGIYYGLYEKTRTAKIVSGDTKYTGSITIPATIKYRNTSYDVTSIGNQAFSGCPGLLSISIPNSITSIGNQAFWKCTSLTSITIPNSVTLIGSQAFYGCTSLKSVTISTNIKTISYDTFAFCTSLESVIIPSEVTSIGEAAFWNCSELNSITIPQSVTSIKERAFSGCSNLTNVFISDIPRWCCIKFSNPYSNPLYYAKHLFVNVKKEIKDNIFTESIEEVNDLIIPNSVTTIGSYAFNNFTGLTSVTLPNSITYIGSNVFTGCTGELTVNCNIPNASSSNGPFYGSKFNSIIIGDDVTSIGSYAFEGCSNITSIEIPKNMMSIGDYAFIDCPKLTTVTINSIKTMGNSPFEGCRGTLNINCNIPDASSNSKGLFYGAKFSNVEIGENVESIGSSAFQGCTDLTFISIPDSVVSIGDKAFADCSNLYDIFIGKSVESIGRYAFNGCNGMKFVRIKDLSTWCKIDFHDEYSNPIIFTKKFYMGHDEVKDLIIPDGVISIGERAFYGCSSLTSLTIPNSVETINYRAFYGCSGLTSISFGNGLTSIDDQIFKGCTGLTSVVIPNSVTEIGEESFEACTGLTSVIIPNSVKKIGSSFCECTGLTSITIPEGVQSIGKDAFLGCSKLATINIANSVTDIGFRAFQGTAWYNSQLDGMVYAGKVAYIYKGTMPENTSIEFKQGTLGIGGYAFSSRSELTSITIPSSVKTIGSGAFHGCSGLTSITIPNSVTSIGNSAFYGCPNIKLYLNKNSVALFDLWKSIISSSTPQMYCKDCIYEINTGKKISLFDKKGSSIRVDKFEPLNYTLTSQSLYINGKNTTMPYYVKGLNSNTSIGNMVLTVEYIDSYGETQTFTENEDVCTEVINLTTNPVKVISAGNVIVGAESNLDDEEENVGFEWRRTDWTDDFSSNTGTAYLYNGQMEGYIRNLNTEKLWKFRAFYTSNSGTTYYSNDGSWIGIDPTNISYFDPTVHTYAAQTVDSNSARLRGYVLPGTDNVIEQGFEYWSESNLSSTQTRTSADNHSTITANGQLMDVIVEYLQPATQYCHRAYVKTAKGITYGEEMKFNTAEDMTGINSALVDNNVNIVGYYNLYGKKITVPERGIVLVRYSNGSTKKVFVK